MKILGVEVSHEGFVPFDGELENYVAHFKHYEPDLVRLHFKSTDEHGIDVSYTAHHTPFERIRRITGYLTGVLSTWNDAKRAEERDRVKHDTKI